MRTERPYSGDYRVPFNRPSLVGNELRYIQESVAAGRISGDGVFTERCRRVLGELLGAPRVLLTTSCTTALELAALLLDLTPGDEVIMPSFTFVSTANAIVLRGARPVFVDIRADTLNLDERLLERAITRSTRAILPVHYAGVGCEMDAILAVAGRHGLQVVEDNAHGLFGRYRGRLLGTFGCLAAQSFHETKNISCGEGGALVINDPDLIERAEIIREKGTNRSRMFRGLVDKYTWVDVGMSALPSDILAALSERRRRHSSRESSAAICEHCPVRARRGRSARRRPTHWTHRAALGGPQRRPLYPLLTLSE
jgi:dTDP-4-amino-4,6-dideoxygalactose transaminase